MIFVSKVKVKMKVKVKTKVLLFIYGLSFFGMAISADLLRSFNHHIGPPPRAVRKTLFCLHLWCPRRDRRVRALSRDRALVDSSVRVTPPLARIHPRNRKTTTTMADGVPRRRGRGNRSRLLLGTFVRLETSFLRLHRKLSTPKLTCWR